MLLVLSLHLLSRQALLKFLLLFGLLRVELRLKLAVAELKTLLDGVCLLASKFFACFFDQQSLACALFLRLDGLAGLLELVIGINHSTDLLGNMLNQQLLLLRRLRVGLCQLLAFSV